MAEVAPKISTRSMVAAEDSRLPSRVGSGWASMGGMSPELPRRPRLAAHVLARRHVIDGQERVILHDQQHDEVLQIGAREWAVLEAADGTRGPEGLVVAARRAGAYVRVAAVRELLVSLSARGMLEAGEEAEPPGAGAGTSGEHGAKVETGRAMLGERGAA